MLPRAICAALTLALLSLPAAAQAIVQDVPTASGSERVLFTGPVTPRATVLMFAGGPGNVQFDSSGRIVSLAENFLLRTEQLWLARGFGFATIGSTSSLLGVRHTPAYADQIAHAIDFVRSRANAPVWLIGTSQGSIAAANGAAHLPGRVQGVVLTSSVAGMGRSGETVFDSDLGAIAVPALVVSNRFDTCPIAGPNYAPQILAALARAPRKDVIHVESHDVRGDPCEAQSPHGYLGIEAEVVGRIADWMGR